MSDQVFSIICCTAGQAWYAARRAVRCWGPRKWRTWLNRRCERRAGIQLIASRTFPREFLHGNAASAQDRSSQRSAVWQGSWHRQAGHGKRWGSLHNQL